MVEEFEKLGSDVSLTEDILRKPPEFIRTWIEWASDNFDQIHRTGGSSGIGSVTILTVPENNTFFLTSLTLSAINSSAVQSVGANVNIHGSGTDNTIASILLPASGGASLNFNSIALAFHLPIKVEAGDIIESVGASNVTTRVTLNGFLVSKRIS